MKEKEMVKTLKRAEEILNKITKGEYAKPEDISKAIEKMITSDDAKIWLITLFLTEKAVTLNHLAQHVAEQKEKNEMMFG